MLTSCTSRARSAFGSARLVHSRFLSSTIRNRELDVLARAVYGSESIERYLNKFSKNESPAFTVIKVGGDVVEYELDILTKTCATLHKVGLRPVIIHGGGPQMNDELKRMGVEPQYIRGSRVTDETTLSVAERIFKELNQRVVKSLESSGVPAAGLPTGIFNATIADPDLKFVGEITDVEMGPILRALDSNHVPVLTSLGQTKEGQLLNINADVAARDVVIALKPMRVLFGSAKGGWIDDDTGKIVNAIDMTNEYESLASLDYEGRQGTLLKLNEIKLILDNVPDTTSVSITSAQNMLKELFSETGAGTTFMTGQAVTVQEGSASHPLLADAPVDCVVKNVFSYGNKVAARVVEYPKLGADLPPVVESFVIDPVSRGMGHENSVWREIKSIYPSLAWKWSFQDDDMKEFQVQADESAFERESSINVSYYNNVHPLNGWTIEKAKRLILEEPRTAPRRSLSNVSAYNVASSDDRYKVGLLGARGYVGREFVKLLTDNPHMDLTVASSRALAGQRVIDCFGLDPSNTSRGVSEDLLFRALEPEDLVNDTAAQVVDVWVLALPNGLAPKFVGPIEAMQNDSVMIDLGADYRFDDTWTYGLPERKGGREQLRGAKRISNPGCYATGAQVGLMPLLEPLSDAQLIQADRNVVPSVFGVSGYSGAGTNPSDKNDPHCLKDNLLPYALVNHMHERECSRHLGTRIGFMPHVASWFQGIHLTLTAQLTDPSASAQDVQNLYEEYYQGEPLIEVSDNVTVRENMFKHTVRVGDFTVDNATGRIALVSTIDNLMKGAASQAIQNLNLSLGIDEYAGIIPPTKK
mmetsp:Transcript_22345/g.35751  ORF Transcript_22345/g.35751 Transcript_22345/m.35751 type:complete len:813 (-) Transcript_22345:2715-5153(-)